MSSGERESIPSKLNKHSFLRMCSRCKEYISKYYCFTCDDLFCKNCKDSVHENVFIYYYYHHFLFCLFIYNEIRLIENITKFDHFYSVMNVILMKVFLLIFIVLIVTNSIVLFVLKQNTQILKKNMNLLELMTMQKEIINMKIKK